MGVNHPAECARCKLGGVRCPREQWDGFVATLDAVAAELVAREDKAWLHGLSKNLRSAAKEMREVGKGRPT